jgi:peptidoglycan/LPS O-acetylase OafA/YrhL
MDPSRARLLPLDGARAVSMALVLSLHCLVSFIQTPIGWAIQDRSTHIVADFLVWTGRAFVMPVFFLLSGFFSRLLIERGGLRGFWRQRAARVLLPFVIALVPTSMAMNALWDRGRALAGRAAVGAQVPVLRASELPVTLSHLWYLYYLLVLSALAFVLPRRPARFSAYLPLIAIIPAAAVLLYEGKLQIDTPLSFRVDPFIAAYYATFFVWGWLLDDAGLAVYARRLSILFVASLALLGALIFPLVASAAPGAPPRAPALALIASAAFTCLAVATFLGACTRIFRTESPLLRLLADGSYWAYVVHLPVAVFLQQEVALLAWPAPLKYFIVASITGGVCLVTWWIFEAALRGFRGALRRGANTKDPAPRESGP